jgi:hypothetical protein
MTDAVAIRVRGCGEDGYAPIFRTIFAVSTTLPAQTFTEVYDPSRGR